MLDMTPEQLLTTTRAVRRRLDVDRPVDRETIRHCLSIATQAPTSVNLQNWHFVVVTDATVRAGIAEWYRRAWRDYSSTALDEDPPGEGSGAASSRHLARILPQVPVLLIPCIEGRPEGRTSGELAALYGSVVQASWSFQLAARA
ncbi:MAG TPA: nitroreductase family protein, partial [Gaiellales bacterium]|nr:nitroreductase family protein [Gaiellales bacterium]